MQATIRKAVIPVAGLGTRLRPMTYVIPKVMMPLVDCRDRVLPVLHFLLAEAKSAGADEVALVVSPQHDVPMREYLSAVRPDGYADLPTRVEFVRQDEPLGFGHAVAQARAFVGDEPFLLMLGDHVYIPAQGAPACAAQVVGAFDRLGGKAVVGMQPVGPEELPRVGVAGGLPIGEGVYRCTNFVEKPDLATAEDKLLAPDLPEGQFLAHCGAYVFDPVVFELLAELSAADRPAGAEVQLADAQAMLLSRYPEEYFLARIAGRAYDTGTPGGYSAALAAFHAGGG